MLAWRLVRFAAVNLMDLRMSPCGTPELPLKMPAKKPTPPDPCTAHDEDNGDDDDDSDGGDMVTVTATTNENDDGGGGGDDDYGKW